ncbi:MAG: histidine kinase dimerization/phosphoacceptor domain -containing protein [Bacteroidota bacterium]
MYPTVKDSLLQLLQTHVTSDSTRVNILNQLSTGYIQTNIDSATHFAEQAIALSKQIKFQPGEAVGNMKLSACYRNKADYSTALEYGISSLKLFEAMDMRRDAAKCHLELAQVYKDMGGQQFTIEFVLKGLEESKTGYSIYESLKDSGNMALSLNVSGIIYRDWGKKEKKYYDTAFACYHKALKLIEQSGKGKENLGRLYNNISQVYSEHKKDYETALSYLFKAVAFNVQKRNTNSLSFNYGNISDVYRKLGNKKGAIDYALKMVTIATQLAAPYRLANAYNQLHKVYKDDYQPDSALKYYKLYDMLDDSLTNISKSAQIAEMQTKYETEKKQVEIVRLGTESMGKSKRIGILLAAMAGLLSLIGLMLWLYRRIKKQKELISQQSHKLELMMKELHHRVKNNLQIVSSLLSLQAYKMHDDEAIAAVNESRQRVEAMGLIHQRLYKTDNLTSVNLKEYITDLLEMLMQSYGYRHDNFDLKIKVEQELLDVDKALPMGLIINEVVTNAFKYAYKDIDHPSLIISFIHENDNIKLSIQDNGKGLDEKTWQKKGGSFGKQLVATLCKQIRAGQILDTTAGTRFTFTIPATSKVA